MWTLFSILRNCCNSAHLCRNSNPFSVVAYFVLLCGVLQEALCFAVSLGSLEAWRMISLSRTLREF